MPKQTSPYTVGLDTPFTKSEYTQQWFQSVLIIIVLISSDTETLTTETG